VPATKLTLDTIGLLDNGSAKLVIDHNIQMAVNDVDDRGDDGKPRKVMFVLVFQKSEEGLIETRLESKVSLPSYRTGRTMSKVKQTAKNKSELLFQPMAPENPDQQTIEFPDGEVK
jgi:hypothetical protein